MKTPTYWRVLAKHQQQNPKFSHKQWASKHSLMKAILKKSEGKSPRLQESQWSATSQARKGCQTVGKAFLPMMILKIEIPNQLTGNEGNFS